MDRDVYYPEKESGTFYYGVSELEETMAKANEAGTQKACVVGELRWLRDSKHCLYIPCQFWCADPLQAGQFLMACLDGLSPGLFRHATINYVAMKLVEIIWAKDEKYAEKFLLGGAVYASMVERVESSAHRIISKRALQARRAHAVPPRSDDQESPDWQLDF